MSKFARKRPAAEPTPYLKSAAGKILRILGRGKSRAHIFLLEGRRMSYLKEKYAKKGAKPRPDVLAFVNPKGFPHPEEKLAVLGEVYLNKDIVRADRNRGAFLLIHGLLHLLGYTHAGKNDTLKMEKLEKKLARKLKIAGF